MLSLLYLYRGRAFVVYWIGSWLLVAAALGLVARSYSDATLGSVLTGLALLFTVSASGLMRLSVESFPQNPVRWDGRRITAMSAAALWFLVAPFVGAAIDCRPHRHARDGRAARMVGRRLSASGATGAIGWRAGDRRSASR